MSKSDLEAKLAFQLHCLGLPRPRREYKFAVKAKRRHWQFDFCWPDIALAVEVEGGSWVHGRHNRPRGFNEDIEKYHTALELGWTVYRTNDVLVNNGRAVELIERLFRQLSP